MRSGLGCERQLALFATYVPGLREVSDRASSEVRTLYIPLSKKRTICCARKTASNCPLNIFLASRYDHDARTLSEEAGGDPVKEPMTANNLLRLLAYY